MSQVKPAKKTGNSRSKTTSPTRPQSDTEAPSELASLGSCTAKPSWFNFVEGMQFKTELGSEIVTLQQLAVIEALTNPTKIVIH